jgi:deazaflavin-dependent oxidoreductase (nitroreductase family)
VGGGTQPKSLLRDAPAASHPEKAMSESDSIYRKPNVTLHGQEHVDRYRETDGVVGHDWCGTRCLILTTIGRKTGMVRDHPLIYSNYGDSFAIVASYAGSPEHPAWYLNLAAAPHVEVQIRGDRFGATARTVEGDERTQVWKLMTETWPNYVEYTKRTSRVIPVVVLDRIRA